MVQKGYLAWAIRANTKRRNNHYFTQNDSGMTDEEFWDRYGEYVHPSVLGSAYQTAEEQAAEMSIIDKYIKYEMEKGMEKERKNKKDVLDKVNFYKLPKKERKLWEEYKNINDEIMKLQNEYKKKNKSIDGEEYSPSIEKKIMLDGGATVSGAAEKIVRGVARTPLGLLDAFFDSYTDGFIAPKTKEFIGKEADITKTVREAIDNRREYSFKTDKASRKSALEAETKIKLEELNNKRNQKIDELATYLHKRTQRLEKQRQKEMERAEYLKYSDAHDEDDSNYEGIFVNGEPLSDYLNRLQTRNRSNQGSRQRRN